MARAPPHVYNAFKSFAVFRKSRRPKCHPNQWFPMTELLSLHIGLCLENVQEKEFI